MMEAEQIAILFERQYKSLEKRNHALMNMVTELSAKVADLEAQLAARDAEIAAWLEQWANAEAFQKALGGITPPVTHEAILRNLATVIASGDYRKETP